MDSAPISTGLLTASLAAVVLIEAIAAAAGFRIGRASMALLAAARVLQLAALLLLARRMAGGTAALGLDRRTLLPGTARGLIWSAGFAAVAGLLAVAVHLAGGQPLALIRSPLPSSREALIGFFVVGGLLAPVTEEVFFRGVIFGYLRRWNVPGAVLISAALFAALHLPALPVTQAVGGLVFAVAYQTGRSLMVPIVIHVLGNLAIFTLSLPFFQ